MELSTLAREMVERGEIRATRKMLLNLVRSRFPETLTPDVERAIADLSSLPIMETWLDAALTARTSEDFLAVLRR